MKIRILSKPPSFPDRVAELMVGCEIDLTHMANPDGEDQSLSPEICRILNDTGPESLSRRLAQNFGLESRDNSEPVVSEHSVYVGEILVGIGQRHGEAAEAEAKEILVREHGGLILISQACIPCSCVELVADPAPEPA